MPGRQSRLPLAAAGQHTNPAAINSSGRFLRICELPRRLPVGTADASLTESEAYWQEQTLAALIYGGQWSSPEAAAAGCGALSTDFQTAKYPEAPIYGRRVRLASAEASACRLSLPAASGCRLSLPLTQDALTKRPKTLTIGKLKKVLIRRIRCI